MGKRYYSRHDGEVIDDAVDKVKNAPAVNDTNYVHTDNNYTNEDKEKVNNFFFSQLILDESTNKVTGTTQQVSAVHQAINAGKTPLIKCSSANSFIICSVHNSGSSASMSFEHMQKLYVVNISVSDVITTSCEDISKKFEEQKEFITYLALKQTELEGVKDAIQGYIVHSNNLFDVSKIKKDTVINTSGEAAKSGYDLSDFIKVEANKTIYFSTNKVAFSYYRAAAYDKDKNLIESSYDSIGATTFDVPSNAVYIRFCIKNTYTYRNVMVQYDGITDYEPYKEGLDVVRNEPFGALESRVEVLEGNKPEGLIVINDWVSGRYSPAGTIATDESRECIEVNIKGVDKIKIKAASTGSSTYSMIMSGNTILKSWNNVVIDEEIDLKASYPTATSIRLTNRTTTDRMIGLYSMPNSAFMQQGYGEVIKDINNHNSNTLTTQIGTAYNNDLFINISKGSIFTLSINGNSGLFANDIVSIIFTYADGTKETLAGSYKALNYQGTYTASKDITKITINRSGSGVVGEGNVTLSANADKYFSRQETLDSIANNSNKFVYVATDGNDDNDGSEAKPFATFAKALASNTTIIYVKAGTYAEDITASYKDISIIAHGGKVILDGTNLSNQVIRLEKCKVYIVGICVANSAKDGFYLKGCSGIVKDCEAYGCKTDGFEFGGSSLNVYDCYAHNNLTDGFGAHAYSGYIASVNMFNCIAKDNADDGLSFHDAECGNVYGGEYCGHTNPTSGGIVPYGQSVINVTGAYIHDNAKGLYAFQSGTISANPIIRSFNNLIVRNTAGIHAAYYDIISVNDKFADNTQDIKEVSGVVPRY